MKAPPRLQRPPYLPPCFFILSMQIRFIPVWIAMKFVPAFACSSVIRKRSSSVISTPAPDFLIASMKAW